MVEDSPRNSFFFLYVFLVWLFDLAAAWEEQNSTTSIRFSSECVHGVRTTDVDEIEKLLDFFVANG